MSLSKAKHQHTDRTLKEKIEILGKLDCGVKAVDLCKQFNLSQSTLSTWKKQRAKLNEMVDAGKVLNQKRNRFVLFHVEEVEDKAYKYICIKWYACRRGRRFNYNAYTYSKSHLTQVCGCLSETKRSRALHILEKSSTLLSYFSIHISSGSVCRMC